jgi:LDH2 family malate/lactate/ureidoglycolate dehydrogenase
MDGLIREIKALPKAVGSDRIYLPGEMEWERRERALVHGIPLPDDVRASLRGLSDDLGMAASESI